MNDGTDNVEEVDNNEYDAEVASARVKVGVTRKSYTSSAKKVLFNSLNGVATLINDTKKSWVST